MSCNNPIRFEVSPGRYENVPCGFCQGCRIDRQSIWALRIEQEQISYEKKGIPSSFVLFTYSDENIPVYGAMKEHIQLFNKRLRMALKRGSFYSDITGKRVLYKVPHFDFKFFVVSEYAPVTNRIHYHAVYLGLPPSLDYVFRHLWRYGFVFVKPLLSGGARYLLKYLEKTYSVKQEREYYFSRGLNPPFRLISKGLGSSFFQLRRKEIKDNNGCILIKGKKVPVPSFVRRKFGVYRSPDVENIRKIREKAKNAKKSIDTYMNEVYDIREHSLVAQARGHGEIVKNVRLISPDDKE